ncbi:MAG: formate-dependent phosphoribosylglycinamide formyltransferase [Sulfurovum sp.]|nr:formate-dependent phosphoribosylglycinamide formyltransferase [Sulfurovum sp.]MCB4745053.1 formate-dependent phosphoribosylglycinamide formyltransferase [Sulfurovum sp.]MCB4747150.1 formate-dependent phosphoribosylglycinamide formyltransferase [Sulfurovum sp.]MCB4751353.1 formate-dependent phosphoribosylglycinamide formyltransferase [Sulfurovum sp.]MCB4754616.1 formate-dependent phosphoribosylglycinamide formyltransferase [Sulfurovum sp.]
MKFAVPLQKNAIKIMLLGSGELGKEIIIEAQRLGLETIAVDKYVNAPAHQVAHRSHIIDMQDETAVLEVIEKEKPDYILPEVEAISISALFEAEKRGYHVIPNAEAVNKTMNRKNIRVFAAETLGLKVSAYRFVKTKEELKAAANILGYPCVVKPVMSSSGHGQTILRTPEEIGHSWEVAKEARGDASELIVEEFIDFDYEITLLTVRNETGTKFCHPIGHTQQDGDFILSWQPIQMSQTVLSKAQEIAKAVTDGLGGRGIFGVEFFIKDDEVYFSELSPRPHDTGMVTLITQSQSEFALHVRAVLGLPLDFIHYGNGACGAYKAKGESDNPLLDIPNDAFSANSFVRIFGKPEMHKGRRMAISLVFDEDIEAAKTKAKKIISHIINK